MGRLWSQGPRSGVITHCFLAPRGQSCQHFGQVVVDPDVVRMALCGRLEQGDRYTRIARFSQRRGELENAGGRQLGELAILSQGEEGGALLSDVRTLDQSAE